MAQHTLGRSLPSQQRMPPWSVSWFYGFSREARLIRQYNRHLEGGPRQTPGVILTGEERPRGIISSPIQPYGKWTVDDGGEGTITITTKEIARLDTMRVLAGYD